MKNLKLVYMQKRKSIKMQRVPPLLLTLHWESFKKKKKQAILTNQCKALKEKRKNKLLRISTNWINNPESNRENENAARYNAKRAQNIKNQPQIFD